jgi:hypothetical protein
MRKSYQYRGVMAKIAREFDDLLARLIFAQSKRLCQRSDCRAVIDKDKLKIRGDFFGCIEAPLRGPDLIGSG